MKRFLLALVAGATFATAGTVQAVPAIDPAPDRTTVLSDKAGATPYRVVGSGDSILELVLRNDLLDPWPTLADRWIISEPCRAPWLSGCDNRASTVTEVTWLMGSVSPGGFVVVQDGGIGDKNGLATTLDKWRQFVQAVINVVPNDRTIVFVLPASSQAGTFTVSGHAPGSTARQIMADRGSAARGVFAANPAQPVRYIDWFAMTTGNPALLAADGLHPSVRPADTTNSGAHALARQLAWQTR